MWIALQPHQLRHRSQPPAADSSRDAQRGFTIVELLIVIVVIGILAAIVIVAYNGISSKARASALISTLDQASKKLDIAKISGGTDVYPASLAAAGVPDANGITYTYTSSNTIAPAAPQTYCLTATSNSGALSYHIATGGTPTPGPCPGDAGTQVPDLSCPTGYITVPGSSLYGTQAFCTMKYEAKNVGGVATSVAAGYPWVSTSQTSAITTSQAACSGCHLISEAEWLTIAQNVLSVSSNWSGGTVGNGYIYSGHNDNAPANAIAADTNDANGYSAETNTGGNQRRTLTLTNGQVIWDLSGNVYEWTQGTTAGAGTQPGLLTDSGDTWKQWNNASLLVGSFPNIFPNYGTPAAANWTSNQGIGQLYSNYNQAGASAFRRGGGWSSGGSAGVLTLLLNYAPSTANTSVGFRVSR